MVVYVQIVIKNKRKQSLEHTITSPLCTENIDKYHILLSSSKKSYKIVKEALIYLDESDPHYIKLDFVRHTEPVLW